VTAIGYGLVIVGGAGQLGRALQRAYPGAVAVGRSDVDITSNGAVRALMAAHAPAAVINAAAYTDVDGCELDPARAVAVNTDAAGVVARHAAAHHARLIHLSTDYVFSGSRHESYTEFDDTDPVQVYGVSKRDGELQVLHHHPGAVVVRTSWLSAADSTNFVTVIADRLSSGASVDVVDDQFGSLTHADDLALALGDLLPGGVVGRSGGSSEADGAGGAGATIAGIVHACNSGRWSRYGLAVAIATRLGVDRALVRAVSTADLEPPRPARRPACVELASTRWQHGLTSGDDALARLLGQREQHRPPRSPKSV
jgi:dTDP-4-dehydrorhamnose reductase